MGAAVLAPIAVGCVVLADAGMKRPVLPPHSTVDYNRDIRPIFSAKCFACHGADPKAIQAGLRLDKSDDAKKLLSSGRHAIVPGKSAQSSLFARITTNDNAKKMPPASTQKLLNILEIDLIKRWIDQGAIYKDHWAFVAPIRPPVPAVQLKSWVRNPIDNFVLSRLEREGLKPSPPANRVTLLRRVSMDLTGLPPTPAEIDTYITDKSPNAFELAVDRLLASPRYGERMAQSWMDGARYADSNGYQADYERFQWPWRDWVIKAFNQNMPFDQFTVEQIAGDLLPNATLDQKVATGFNRNHRINTEGGIIAEEWRVETIVDRLETTGAVWMGLTIGCGRCHDHKYDPISQKEFYQIFAYFNNVPESGIGVERPVNHPPLAKLEAPGDDKKRVLLASAVKAAEGSVKELSGGGNSPELEHAKAELAKEKKTLDEFENAIPTVMVMDEMAKPRDCFVLVRGQYDKHGDKVEAAIPAAFPPLPKGAPNNRLGFAKWMVDPKNPLTARVAVNRFWEKFFGIGIVATSEDFGTRADSPSHPELLDWLATEFVRLKWDMKAMQKEIVMSATYRQSSKVTPEQIHRDPDNRLLARGPRYRLPAEMIRDQALMASGLLVEKLGGPSVRPYMPEGIWDEVNVYGNLRNYKHDKGDNLYRRSLYTIWKRTSAPPSLTLFDVPGREMCRVRRSRTNTPLQALSLMNEITYVEAARVLAQKTLEEGGSTVPDRIKYAVRKVLGRSPSAQELNSLVAGLNRRLKHFKDHPSDANELASAGDYPRDNKLDVAELAAYTTTASILFNMDETITKE